MNEVLLRMASRKRPRENKADRLELDLLLISKLQSSGQKDSKKQKDPPRLWQSRSLKASRPTKIVLVSLHIVR